MVGSANQEKLLEERHRQRELEKKTAAPVSTQRDSRLDDFDEDSFDYDAMMDDDGLEERIPGINADAEEEDDFGESADPDDDQENFSGFVFQRSNQASTLPTPLTPGMVSTPRDANGVVIGFAVTRDIPLEEQWLDRQMDTAERRKAEIGHDHAMTAGLGIQGLDVDHHAAQQNTESFGQNGRLPPSHSEDDLYFDQGLLDELSFGDPDNSVPFDESLFDTNDTDQYGRPIPGAFAQAKAMAMRASIDQDAGKHESASTSRLSGQSQISQSTAHTSISVGGPQPHPSLQKHQSDDQPERPETPPSRLFTEEDRVVAYQAALAEAAHKAAASGKFRRDSSPPPPPVADLTFSSPTLGSESVGQNISSNNKNASSSPSSSSSSHRREHSDHPFYDEHDDDDGHDFSQDMNDYDFDDEAIIAEANAEALANDMDGFYGQEFGFYAAPTQSHATGAPPASKAPLNAQNLYEYASGGLLRPLRGPRPDHVGPHHLARAEPHADHGAVRILEPQQHHVARRAARGRQRGDAVPGPRPASHDDR